MISVYKFLSWWHFCLCRICCFKNNVDRCAKPSADGLPVRHSLMQTTTYMYSLHSSNNQKQNDVSVTVEKLKHCLHTRGLQEPSFFMGAKTINSTKCLWWWAIALKASLSSKAVQLFLKGCYCVILFSVLVVVLRGKKCIHILHVCCRYLC